MDPKNIAVRKALAIERIEKALTTLVMDHGFDLAAAGIVRNNYADALTADMLRLEGIAGFVDSLVVMVSKAAAVETLPEPALLPQPGLKKGRAK